MKIKNKVVGNFILAILIAFSTTFFCVTFARYVMNIDIVEQLMESNKFYFYSSQLTTGGITNNLYEYNSASNYSFSFEVYNYKDSLRISGMSYTYNISAPTGCTVKINNVSTTTGSFTADTLQTDTVEITIPQGTTFTNNSFMISAVVMSPYSKVLSSTYTLNSGLANIEKSVEVNNIYVDLIVGVKNSGTYSIIWPAGVSPDNTDILLRNALDTDRTVDVVLNSNSSHRFRFFLTSATTEINEQSFTVTKQ